MGRYKLLKDDDGNTTGVLINDGTHPNLPQGTTIPNNTDHRLWQEYLEWEESNDADAADTIDWMQRMRDQRDSLLAACDWTGCDDNQLSASVKSEWETYRQDLRDMPQDNPSVTTKSAFDALEWPTAPA